jgi:hypothetical protein
MFDHLAGVIDDFTRALGLDRYALFLRITAVPWASDSRSPIPSASARC